VSVLWREDAMGPWWAQRRSAIDPGGDGGRRRRLTDPLGLRVWNADVRTRGRGQRAGASTSGRHPSSTSRLRISAHLSTA